jgi:hypothetical protein
MSKKKPKIDSLSSIGALVGVGIGVVTKRGVFTTLFLGSLFAGIGHYIQTKIN